MKAPLCHHMECWEAAIDGKPVECPHLREQIETLKHWTGIPRDRDICAFALRLLDYLLRPEANQLACLDLCEHGVDPDGRHPCMECAAARADAANDMRREDGL